jgi:hypothetical protein
MSLRPGYHKTVRGMLYAVCTRCTFLRAFSRDAPSPAPERCPLCDGELLVRRKAGRFQPAYIGKVSLELHMAPPLEREQPPR